MAVPEEDAATAFIRQAKEMYRPFLVKGIPDDLFQPGREVELRERVTMVVDWRLIQDKVPIGRSLRELLIASIMDDIARVTKERFGSLTVQAEEDIAAKFTRLFKEAVRPDLLRETHDDLLQPGQEEELQKHISAIVDRHIAKDRLPVGEKLRERVIASFMSDIEKAKKSGWG